MNIHVGFWREKEDGRWIVTGVLDDFANMMKLAASKRAQGPIAVVESIDEDLKSILAAHEEAIGAEDVKKAPASRDDAEGAFRRFLTAAFG